MNLSNSMKKGLVLGGVALCYVILEKIILDKRKKYLTTEDVKIIYQLKNKKRFSRKINSANEAFADFEPLGTGQKIQDFRR